MRSFQTKMDVISNNIANVNTTGFKSGRAQFQDMLSQTVSNAQGANANGLGGVNSQQVGIGVRVGSIDTIMTGGPTQPTSRDLDFAIENDGFFILGTGENLVYTRDGAFFKDGQGNLVNSGGMRVMGYKLEGDPLKYNTENLVSLKIPETDPENDPDGGELENYFIDGSGVITAKYKGNDDLVNIGKMGLARFSNPEGLEKLGSNNYGVTNNSGAARNGESGIDGFGTILQGFIEMSNVDLANEFTDMIIASRAYSANSRSITTSDEMLQELINLKR